MRPLCMVVCMVLVLAASAVPGVARAQQYPMRPVTILFPWPPGGADLLPRAMAERMSETLGQPVRVENRPGAGGTVGMAMLARAPADGHVVGMTDMSSHAISASLYRKLPYDVIRDFEPVAMAARSPLALAVHPSLGVRTIDDLVRLAKSRPGRLNFASSGNGAITHLAAERFKRMAGVDLVHVPYNGSAPAVGAVLSGSASATFATIPAVIGNAKAGKLVLLGVTFTRPSPALPDVPPVAGTLQGFDMGLYQGMVAPAGTPRAVVDRLHGAVVRSLEDPKVRGILARAALEPVPMGPEQFREFLVREVKGWAELVDAVGLRVD